jgi:hypothetical protein
VKRGGFADRSGVEARGLNNIALSIGVQTCCRVVNNGSRCTYRKGWKLPCGLFEEISGASRQLLAATQFRHVLLLLLRRFEDLRTCQYRERGAAWCETHLEGTQEALVDTHHGASIIEFTAVVRCAEERNQLPFREELVAVFHDLMGAANEIHVMLLKESRYDVRTEREGYTAIVFAPAGDVLVGIGPQQIAKQTAIRDLWAQG